MVALNGKNLGQRQKDLNVKVNEAVLNNVNFEEIKDKAEQCDVDTLFKIDVASKYKNIEYIIQVLKSGDSLHISRALKCDWMFNDEFSHIISTDYLHHNVFPYMSQKMKRKVLTAISMNVRNGDRAIAFCNYCMEGKLTNLAQKFIYFTDDAYKLDFLQKFPNLVSGLRNKNNLTHFIGDSFSLADAYLLTLDDESSKLEAINELSYLYSISDVKYLDMLESHVSFIVDVTRLGKLISQGIITKHKDRVLKKPSLYVNFLNKKFILKYSTPENVKIYAVDLLPEVVLGFWRGQFCNSYEFIINILPLEERFEFLKKIFSDKYPGKPFETDFTFYDLRMYRFMTTEQKQKWALDQIASQNEILGIGNDYKWYRFITFEKAFTEIKKLIMITPDNVKRSKMINILVESAKTQRELEQLFKHYYDRHNNELPHFKDNFVNLVDTNHNVFEFDKDCWQAFNKIYQNLDVYSMSETNRGRYSLKMIALLYHIINKVEVPESLKPCIDNSMNFYDLKQNTDKMSKEQQEMVYQYLFNYYMDKLNDFNLDSYNDEMKYKIRKYIFNILDLLHKYNKTEQDIPEIVMKLMKLDWEEFNRHALLYKPTKETSQEDIIRFLKEDSNTFVDNLPLVKKNIEEKCKFDLGHLLKKIKVYFNNDISKVCLSFYNEMLTASQVQSKVARAACFGIFQLADDKFKVDFLTKHAPTQSKVNRSEIDETLLNIQEAICATAIYSRPPVPLNNILIYLQGDYVKKCLPMFNYYFAHLPGPLCKDFIEAILDKPLSIQKHGVRLAFVSFDTANLTKLILSTWQKTKNVSFRHIIYKSLFDKITAETENKQTELFETLKKLTLELQQDDDSQVFELLTSGRLPERFITDYANIAWTAVSALPISNSNIERKANLIEYLYNNIRTISHVVIRPIVEEFVKGAYTTEESVKFHLESTKLNQCYWDLTANYIMCVQNKDDLEIKLKLTRTIFKECLSRVGLLTENKYIMRSFIFEYLRKLLRLSLTYNSGAHEYINAIFETILQMLHDSLSIENIYMIVWSIRMNMATRKTLFNINTNISTIDDEAEKYVVVKSHISNFGTDIGNLIMEFIKTEMYLPSLLPDIQEKLTDEIRNLDYNTEGLDGLLNIHDLTVVACLGLVEFRTREMYSFLLNVLPSYYSWHYTEEYEYILNKIKDLDHIDIKCKMYEKFLNSNFEIRTFLQL